MTDKLEEIQIQFMNRRARKRGPTSSDQINDTNDEIAADLSSFNSQWNNRLVPLTTTLPDGTVSSDVDAFLNGLDGANMYVDSDSTASNNSDYYNSTAGRPNTTLEQFQVQDAALTNATDDLQNQINNKILTAAQISVVDAGGNYVATNVEDALTEISTSISSLTSGGGSVDLTAVTTDIIPDTDDTYDIGTGALRFKDAYFAGRITLPQENLPATPSVAFGDGDSGFYESADDTLNMSIAGAAAWIWGSTLFAADGIADAPVLVRTASTATVPNVIPSSADFNTGMGHNTADQLSLIAGGLEMLRLSETGTSATDQIIIGPAGIIGAAATPSLAFGDGDSGFYENTDDVIDVATAGVGRFRFDSGSFHSTISNSAGLVYETPTSTNPSAVPNVNDPDTGIGWTAADQLSLIAGGVQVANLTEAAGVVQMVLPLQDNATAPSLAFGNGDTGFYERLDDQLSVTAGGTEIFRFTSAGGFRGADASGPAISNLNASATVANIFPDINDTDTGLGTGAADQLSLIAGGVQVANLTEAAGVVQVVLPLQNDAAAPSLAFGDGDSGFYESSDDNIELSVAGTVRWSWNANAFEAGSGRGAIRNEVPSSTNPVLIPSSNDADTGLGTAAADQLSLIAGGVEGLRITETGSQIQAQFNGQVWSEQQADLTPSGTTETIDWNDGNSVILDLESATGDVTLTLNNAQSGARYTIVVIQDSTVARDLVWPATVFWPGGTAPVISTGADNIDKIELYYNGTNYLGTFSQNFS